MEECIENYLRTKLPGLYHVLVLLADGVPLSREVVLRLVKRLYGQEAAEYLDRSIEKTCFKS